MNPDTNKFENLTKVIENEKQAKDLAEKFAEMQRGHEIPSLVRPDGTQVPKHWSIFSVGENYIINNYTFCCRYIGETSILFEPVGAIEIK